MKEANRDLLVLSHNTRLTEKQLDLQMAALHQLLYQLESWEQFCIANEIIDANRYQIIQKPYKMQQALQEAKTKPFLFVCNKN